MNEINDENFNQLEILRYKKNTLLLKNLQFSGKTSYFYRETYFNSYKIKLCD